MQLGAQVIDLNGFAYRKPTASFFIFWVFVSFCSPIKHAIHTLFGKHSFRIEHRVKFA